MVSRFIVYERTLSWNEISKTMTSFESNTARYFWYASSPVSSVPFIEMRVPFFGTPARSAGLLGYTWRMDSVCSALGSYQNSSPISPVMTLVFLDSMTAALCEGGV